MTNKLLPCPFCNEAPHIDRTVREYPADDQHPAGEYEAWVNISCDTCGFQLGEEYRSDAIQAWNTRGGIAPGSEDDEE